MSEDPDLRMDILEGRIGALYTEIRNKFAELEDRIQELAEQLPIKPRLQ